MTEACACPCHGGWQRDTRTFGDQPHPASIDAQQRIEACKQIETLLFDAGLSTMSGGALVAVIERLVKDREEVLALVTPVANGDPSDADNICCEVFDVLTRSA